MQRVLGSACVLGLFLCASVASATTYYLKPDAGADSNPGTQAAPWKTLDKVAASVGPGDTVTIQAGTYTPDQYVQGGGWFQWQAQHRRGTAGQPITLQGEGTVVFDGQRQPGWITFAGGDHYVVVKGLTFQHFQPGIVSVNPGAGYVAVVQ